MPLEIGLDPRALGAAATLLVVFLVLYITFTGFSMVGITPGEVIVVLFLAPFVAWVNLPLIEVSGVVLGVNAAGALIPLGLAIRFISQGRLPAWKAIAGTTVVSAVAYMVATVDPETGVLVPSLPIVAVSLITGLSLSGDKWKQVGPVTYFSGALGTLVGADLLNLPVILDPATQGPAFAVIGGAGTLDAIYLIALVAVIGSILAVAVARVLGWIGSD